MFLFPMMNWVTIFVCLSSAPGVANGLCLSTEALWSGIPDASDMPLLWQYHNKFPLLCPQAARQTSIPQNSGIACLGETPWDRCVSSNHHSRSSQNGSSHATKTDLPQQSQQLRTTSRDFILRNIQNKSCPLYNPE